MKRKLTAFFIAAVMVSVMIPGRVSAAGTGDGSSIDNARPVASSAELTAALADPAAIFIETTSAFDLMSDIEIPAGKSLVVQPVSGTDPALSIGACSVKVDAGATLINNGGIGYTHDSSLDLSGGLINNAKMTAITVMIDGGGSLQNSPAAQMDGNCAIFLNAGNIANQGSISCMIYQTGSSGVCTITGVDASQIRPTNPIKACQDMTFNPLNLEENVNNTVGLSGDNSEFIIAPDGWKIFALGYAISLTAGQTVAIQTNADYKYYIYLFNPDKSDYVDAGSGGMTFTADTTGTYYLIVGGYDTIFRGSLSITVIDPSAHTPEGLRLIAAESATGTGWAWDKPTKTLTLSGIVLTSGYDTAILLPEGSTIVLASGTNNIINSNRDGIACTGDLTITGSGSLSINSNASDPSMNVSDVSLQKIPDMHACISSQKNLHLYNTGAINCASGGRYAFWAKGDLLIENCVDITAISEYGIGFAAGMSLSITGSNITARGYYFGICTGPYAIILGSDSVMSTDKAEAAELPADMVTSFIQLPEGGDITITDSTVDASSWLSDSVGAAIYAGDNIGFSDPTTASVQAPAKIVLNGSIISQPTGGYIVDASFGGLKCQSITSIQGLTEIEDSSKAAKSVLIEPVYTLGYNPNGGTGSATNPGPLTPSSKLTASQNPYTYTGLTFTGWNTAADGSGTSYKPGDVIKVTKNMVLYAMWKVNTYTVRFVDWNGAEISRVTVNHGASAKAPSNPSRSGYTFKVWDKSFSNVTSDLTVTAQYNAAAVAIPKTGETGGCQTLAWAFLTMAAGGCIVVAVIRKRANS